MDGFCYKMFYNFNLREHATNSKTCKQMILFFELNQKAFKFVFVKALN